jgi:hypothetical protein
MGTWWEQKEFDWNLMRTKGIWWVIWWEQEEFHRNFLGIDANKKHLTRYWWEQEEFDGNCLGTWWEIKPPHPFKKIRNIPWGHVCATLLAHPYVLYFNLEIIFFKKIIRGLNYIFLNFKMFKFFVLILYCVLHCCSTFFGSLINLNRHYDVF